MTASFRDPTLAELLDDPITRAVMHADGVNPRELETSLRALSARRADWPNTSNPPGDGASRCAERHDHGRIFH